MKCAALADRGVVAISCTYSILPVDIRTDLVRLRSLSHDCLYNYATFWTQLVVCGSARRVGLARAAQEHDRRADDRCFRGQAAANHLTGVHGRLCSPSVPTPGSTYVVQMLQFAFKYMTWSWLGSEQVHQESIGRAGN